MTERVRTKSVNRTEQTSTERTETTSQRDVVDLSETDKLLDEIDAILDEVEEETKTREAEALAEAMLSAGLAREPDCTDCH